MRLTSNGKHALFYPPSIDPHPSDFKKIKLAIAIVTKMMKMIAGSSMTMWDKNGGQDSRIEFDYGDTNCLEKVAELEEE